MGQVIQLFPNKNEVVTITPITEPAKRVNRDFSELKDAKGVNLDAGLFLEMLDTLAFYENGNIDNGAMATIMLNRALG